MDFFDRQDDARKHTFWLVVLFVLAVAILMVLTYGVVAVILAWMGMGHREVSTAGGMRGGGAGLDWASIFFRPNVMAWVGAWVAVIVLGGSIYKIAQLRHSGGEGLAASLGGRPVAPDNAEPEDRQLLNVVEEMAIASGTAVPPVFVMEKEAGINAFAAGYAPADAVICVTRGALDQLSRSELEGVIGHEFSHILNGDMRLNIRLMGVIHGILVIGLIGTYITRAAAWSSAGYSSRDRNRGSALPLILGGLALTIIGYAGTFFGRLMKAAVSRQREYLADASSVQFTREPDGLAGALRKIGGYTFSSNMVSPNAEQASHMLFGQGLNLSLLMATHPPLARRIKAIQPGWDGSFPEVEPSERVKQKISRKQASLAGGAALAGGGARAAAATGSAERGAGGEEAGADRRRVAPEAVSQGAGGGGSVGGGKTTSQSNAIGQIGQPTPEHMDYAARLKEEIPDEIQDAARESYGARAVVYALLFDDKPAVREKQTQRLVAEADWHVYHLASRLADSLAALAPRARLPLLDMALPALRRLSHPQYVRFKGNVESLIQADEKVDLFEWMLRRVILHHLEPQFTHGKRPPRRRRKLESVAEQAAALLSTLAYVGQRDVEQARQAFAKAAEVLDMNSLSMRPRERCGLREMDQALDKIAQASPRVKKQVLTACAVCIEADKQVSVQEAELLRAISAGLDCPMPPLLPGQSLA